MATVKFVLRFKTEQQKKKLEKIAEKSGRSANSHILYLVDNDIEVNKKWAVVKKQKD
jgi:hypothetical protein